MRFGVGMQRFVDYIRVLVATDCFTSTNQTPNIYGQIDEIGPCW